LDAEATFASETERGVEIMPRTSNPARYPVAYANLLRAFHLRGGVLEVPTQSPEEATTLRHKLYSYFRAMRKVEGFEELVAIADTLVMHLDGSTIKLVPLEDTWDAQAITGALDGLEPHPAQADPLTASVEISTEARAAMLDKLQELRARNS
jgi:hypothetical protein